MICLKHSDNKGSINDWKYNMDNLLIIIIDITIIIKDI